MSESTLIYVRVHAFVIAPHPPKLSQTRAGVPVLSYPLLHVPVAVVPAFASGKVAYPVELDPLTAAQVNSRNVQSAIARLHRQMRPRVNFHPGVLIHGLETAPQTVFVHVAVGVVIPNVERQTPVAIIPVFVCGKLAFPIVALMQRVTEK